MHTSELSSEPLKIYTFRTYFEVYVTLFGLKNNGADNITVHAYKSGLRSSMIYSSFPPLILSYVGLNEVKRGLVECVLYQEKGEHFLGLNH